MAETSGRGGVPIGADERSTLLDALRGYALLGILIANMAGFIGFYFVENAARSALLLSRFNELSGFLVEWLIVGKFYSIFSLLFGIGFALQLGRLEARRNRVPEEPGRNRGGTGCRSFAYLLIVAGDIPQPLRSIPTTSSPIRK